MKSQLSSDQLQQYQRDGFVHISGLLDPAEIDELKQAVLDTVTELGERRLAGTDEQKIAGDDYYNKVFTQRLNLWKINATIKRYLQGPELGGMAAQLEGVDRMRVYLDQALIKEPFGNPTAWHLDNPYWAFHSRHATSVWIALEDATLQNGCLSFIPGSHRLATFDNVGIGNQLDALFTVYPKMKETAPVPVPMKAGDCSFHNGLVAHGAGANMTNGRRIAMTAAYMPEGSTYNGQEDILPGDYAKSLQVGEVLNRDDIHLPVGQPMAVAI